MILKNIVLANSLFSGISGIGMLLLSTAIASLFNMETTLVIKLVALNLLIFSLILALIIRYSRYKLVKHVIILDWAWVAGSIVLIIGLYDQISISGITLILVVAIIVLCLALFQQKHLKHYKSNGSLSS